MPIRTSTRRGDKEAGATVVEVMLILPILALGFMVLLGSADIILKKQEALLASRYATTFSWIAGATASTAELSTATNPAHKAWMLTSETGGNGASLLGGITELAEQIAGAVSATRLGVTFRASQDLVATPERRFLGFTDVEAKYTLPGDTWTAEGPGPFLILLEDELSKIHLVN